jgi:hypothetical protein
MSTPRAFREIHQAPSGQGYRLWDSGDGLEVFREDGKQIADCGARVPVVPLADVPFVAGLLAAAVLRSSHEDEPK